MRAAALHTSRYFEKWERDQFIYRRLDIVVWRGEHTAVAGSVHRFMLSFDWLFHFLLISTWWRPYRKHKLQTIKKKNKKKYPDIQRLFDLKNNQIHAQSQINIACRSMRNKLSYTRRNIRVIWRDAVRKVCSGIWRKRIVSWRPAYAIDPLRVIFASES